MASGKTPYGTKAWVDLRDISLAGKDADVYGIATSVIPYRMNACVSIGLTGFPAGSSMLPAFPDICVCACNGRCARYIGLLSDLLTGIPPWSRAGSWPSADNFSSAARNLITSASRNMTFPYEWSSSLSFPLACDLSALPLVDDARWSGPSLTPMFSIPVYRELVAFADCAEGGVLNNDRGGCLGPKVGRCVLYQHNSEQPDISILLIRVQHSPFTCPNHNRSMRIREPAPCLSWSTKIKTYLLLLIRRRQSPRFLQLLPELLNLGFQIRVLLLQRLRPTLIPSCLIDTRLGLAHILTSSTHRSSSIALSRWLHSSVCAR